MHDEEYQSKIIDLDKRIQEQEILVSQINLAQDKINEKYTESRAAQLRMKVIQT